MMRYVQFQTGLEIDMMRYVQFQTGLEIVLLVKRNTLILYSYFHRMFMFLLFLSVTFYGCIKKKPLAKLFLSHFLTLMEILQKS